MAVRSHKLHCELSEHVSYSRDLGPQTALGQVGAMECAEAEDREAGNLGTCARVHVCIYACVCASGVCQLIAGRYLGEKSKPVIMSGKMTCIDKVSSDGFRLIS